MYLLTEMEAYALDHATLGHVFSKHNVRDHSFLFLVSKYFDVGKGRFLT